MIIRFLGLALFIALLSACASWHSNSDQNSDQLYRDLGGQPGIERLIDGLLDNIARDDRIFAKFRDANIDRLRSKLIEKFCNLSGGPCEYTGTTLQQAHGGLAVSEAEFNALVEDLIDAMESQHVPVSAQNRLLARLAPLRPQVLHQ